MSSSNLNKKRLRASDPVSIIVGKLPHNNYYYISDSLSGGNTKIKISMIDLTNTKEEKQISLKEHEEENDNSLDILNLGNQILKDEMPKIVNNIKSNETEQIYLPISASWFNFDNIHEIEIKSLPEFFCGKYPSKTPQVYKKYRNFIINLYRENSTMYLSSNACRKHLAGDAFAILRIHSFLEHWGLINFKINAKFKPNFIPKAFNFKSPIYIDSNLFMFDNNSPNNNNISNYNNPESNIVLTNQNKNIATLYPINNLSNKIFNNFLNDCISDKENCENSELKKFEKINFLSQNYRPKCDVCGNLCTMDWYITKDNKNEEENDSDNDLNFSINIDEKSLYKEYFIVCETCFGDQNIPLPNNLKRENFELSSIYNLFSKEKLNEKIINKLNEQKWTEEEDKKLLEGLKNDKSWDQLMESFGNDKKKTKQDCILHLLQMPMNNMNEKYNNDNDSEDEIEELIEEDEEKGDKIEEIGKVDSQEIKEDNKDINEKGIEKENENENENNNIINENNINNDINNIDANNIINNTKDIIDEDKKNEMNIEESKKDEKNIIDNSNKGLNEKMNNNMIEIFMRLFKRYLNESNDNNENNENNNDEDNNGNILNKSFKEVIYKTFAKSINKCKELKDEEKDEMKRIVDILVYLEMKKIELKMNYFKQFERELEYKKTQLKTIETQIIQERIKLITQKLLLQKKQQQTNEINKNNLV